ncbi:hypothetical protein ACXZ1K_13430 [Pedobacter sp. PWIIR3]
MKKNILLAFLLVIAIGCKKQEFSKDDTNLYKWKRELYRAPVDKEGPAMFYNREGKIGTDHTAVFLNSDFVVLTEYRKDKQQDSIYRASAKVLVYKYEKLENVSK